MISDLNKVVNEKKGSPIKGHPVKRRHLCVAKNMILCRVTSGRQLGFL
jgi:hypothetical protein